MSPLRLLASTLSLLVWPALTFFLAGDWRWPEGWIFSGWFVAMGASTIVWLYRNDPALLIERSRMPGSGGQSRRDRIIVYLIVLGFIVWMGLMPLDARRFHWTPPLPLAVKLVGGAFLAVAWFFLFRACTDNPYASSLVRIQRERGHRVVSTGVYGLVRHPMYLGALLMVVGGPLVTGAASALALIVVVVPLLVARIREEETLLAAGLPGYDDYRRRVRYRLVPYVW